ncbi:hypothetical protein [Sulfoacidibacillus ferrooxidans]|uniref:Lipoprotein n=1 Tax=Sulfoacidibacillus ferrooxidans TaxID=2005001 RepID=A0A9X1VCI4_9BACL|nr:hypothetical protein [Sulfoacidibacillus ferrooxidans]MCI0184849.1 hypothetical protein [Sulfoacidibacillus ferrooxidans]
MKYYKQLATVGIALSIVGILSGCGTTKILQTSTKVTNTHSNQTVSSKQIETNTEVNTSSVTSAGQPSNGTRSFQRVTAFLRINAKYYMNTSEAMKAITRIEQQFGQVNPSGPPVDLGTGIKADFSGGSGQYGYKWNKGDWTILLMGWGNSSLGTQLAKSIVAYMNTHMLPTPQKKGVITIFQPSSSNTPSRSQTTIAWQVGNKVYERKQTGNPLNILATTVNGCDN